MGVAKLTLKCALAIFLHLFAVADKEKGITNDDSQVCPGNIPASLCSSR